MQEVVGPVEKGPPRGDSIGPSLFPRLAQGRYDPDHGAGAAPPIVHRLAAGTGIAFTARVLATPTRHDHDNHGEDEAAASCPA